MSSPRRRRCPPKRRGLLRRGSVRLGELEDKNLGVSGPSRRAKPCLGEGRLCLGELVTV